MPHPHYAAAHKNSSVYSTLTPCATLSIDRTIGMSRLTQKLLRHIVDAAADDSNVYIYGEIGTGKKIAATMIHKLSVRRMHPFVMINCGALYRNRIRPEPAKNEVMLYADAENSFRNCFSKARKGTLFLEDIGQLGPGLQSLLLQLIKETVCSLGNGRSSGAPSPRIITSSHLDLHTSLRNGTLHSEIYHQLRPVLIGVDPLRKCKKDIPALANYYLNCYSKKRKPRELPEAIIRQLLAYDWPGNLYELQNTIERYLVYDQISFLHTRMRTGNN